ncbi:MAG: TetR/AcrR family transcriptional regulator [Clostridiaceae bacterium]
MTITQIKKAALLNFTEKGYDGTSLFDIAEEVGIKKQSIYSHFKNKDELFLTVMDEVINEEMNFLHNFFTHYKADLKSYLEDFILEFKERYVNNEEYNMKFVLRMCYMPPFHLKEKVLKNFKLYFLELENLLNELFLNTKVFSDKVNRATLSFMTLLDGLLVALIYGGVERFNQKFQISWEIYWNGLLND